MSSEEHKTPVYDDVNTRLLAIVGGVATILIMVSIFAVQVVYYRYEQFEFQRKVLANTNDRELAVIAAQRQRINNAGTGAEEGEKSIPIEQAMASVISEYQSRQEAGDTSEPATPNAPAATEGQAEGKPAAGEEEAGDEEAKAPAEAETPQETGSESASSQEE